MIRFIASSALCKPLGGCDPTEAAQLGELNAAVNPTQALGRSTHAVPLTWPEFPIPDFVMGPAVTHRANDSSDWHAGRLRENELPHRLPPARTLSPYPFCEGLCSFARRHRPDDRDVHLLRRVAGKQAFARTPDRRHHLSVGCASEQKKVSVAYAALRHPE